MQWQQQEERPQEWGGEEDRTLLLPLLHGALAWLPLPLEPSSTTAVPLAPAMGTQDWSLDLDDDDDDEDGAASGAGAQELGGGWGGGYRCSLVVSA